MSDDRRVGALKSCMSIKDSFIFCEHMYITMCHLQFIFVLNYVAMRSLACWCYNAWCDPQESSPVVSEMHLRDNITHGTAQYIVGCGHTGTLVDYSQGGRGIGGHIVHGCGRQFCAPFLQHFITITKCTGPLLPFLNLPITSNPSPCSLTLLRSERYNGADL